MELGFIGLGRMGMNMVVRLVRGDHRVVVYNRSPEKVREAEREGAVGTTSIADLAARLERPRAIWVMVPAGAATQQMIDTVVPHLDKGLASTTWTSGPAGASGGSRWATV
jgi:6-phosphogluconate dehydrogenase